MCNDLGDARLFGPNDPDVTPEVFVGDFGAVLRGNIVGGPFAADGLWRFRLRFLPFTLALFDVVFLRFPLFFFLIFFFLELIP
jgi:hypothetical protein